MIIKPYKNNIQISPSSKNKIIGDTAKFFLFGEVLAIGSEVKDIKVGDTIGYTQWGINKIEKGGVEHFFIQDNPDFVLAVITNES